jgi:LysM repeat protein
MIKKLLALLSVTLVALFVVGAANAQTNTDDDVTWNARYWDNVTLSGIPAVERVEEDLGGNWGFGSPAAVIDPNTFSAEWTTRAPFGPGVYQFTSRSDDGIRVWVDGQKLIENWDRHPVETNTAYITVRESQVSDIRVQYFESGGLAEASLDWERVDNIPESDTVSATIDPTQGQAGTTVSLTAAGFPPNIGVEIGLGRANSEYDITDLGTTNANGVLNTTIEISEFADPGEEWVAVVVSGDNELEAISNTFTVVEGEGGIACQSPYTVQFGDTLYGIARACNVDPQALIQANTFLVNPNIIVPGEQIVIPESDDDTDTAPTFDSVSFYLVETNTSDGDIGCGDSLVLQTIDVQPTPTPLTTALNLLLGYDSNLYYNALADADNARVNEIAIDENGAATIDLTGQIPIGGVCDEPRVLAQLRETALRFTTIESVTITLDGTPIEDLYN